MAISDLKNYLQVTAVQRAENKLNDARNLAYTNELYFSDEVIASVNELVDTCHAWFFPWSTRVIAVPTFPSHRRALRCMTRSMGSIRFFIRT